MRQKSEVGKGSSEQIVRDIRRATRKQYSAEEKIRIVLDGLRGEYSIAELCRHEGIAESLYYSWSKEFLEAGKKRLAGDTARAAGMSRRMLKIARLALPGGWILCGLRFLLKSDKIVAMRAERRAQDVELLAGFEPPEPLRGFHHASGRPTQCHLGIAPGFDVAADAADCTIHVFDDVRASKRAAQLHGQAKAGELALRKPSWPELALRVHQQAGHMDASDLTIATANLLQGGAVHIWGQAHGRPPIWQSGRMLSNRRRFEAGGFEPAASVGLATSAAIFLPSLPSPIRSVEPWLSV